VTYSFKYKINKNKYETVFGDSIEKLKYIKDETVDLVIADPPYFKTINQKWDYEWKTNSLYLDWTKKWTAEVIRVLRKGGTFYLFGYFRTLSHILTDLKNSELSFRQQIVIDKGLRSISGRKTSTYKLFPNVTESILFFIKDNKQFIKPLLKERQEKLKLSSKKINQLLGVKANGGGMWSIYTGKNICEQLPTKEFWNKLQQILKFKFPYNRIAQTFNIIKGYTDVWTDIDFYEETKFHPTQKPLKLIDRLVLSSSNKNDLVLDPFGGSGSTLISCIKNNRNCITIEKDKSYFKIINQRIKSIIKSS
jgi:site-specific DNA-methyltransferase (adenine-specific)